MEELKLSLNGALWE